MKEIKTCDLKDASSEVLANEAVKVLLEKKAVAVKLFNVVDKSIVTDFYVNATGRSSTQVASLADEVADFTDNHGRAPLRIEGRSGNAWILVDYGDVIVNIFDKASREFYNLDKHLPEDSEVDISNLVEEVDNKFDLNKKEQ